MSTPSDCMARREEIAGHVLGELDAARAAALSAHLQVCATCRRLHDELTREEDELRATFAGLAQATSLSHDREMRVATGLPSNWRKGFIMRHRWMLTTAAAAAIVLLAVGIWPAEHAVGRAYGMTDIPTLLQDTVLHVRGEAYIPPLPAPGEKQMKVACEYWIDSASGRARRTSYSYAVSASGTKIRLLERVTDGQYVMELDHTDKTATYTRLTELQRVLEARRALASFNQMVFNGGPPEAFTDGGQEQVDGVTYTRWEYILNEPRIGISYKVECLLAPGTGDVGGVRSWMKTQGNDEWRLVLRLDHWDRGVTPPPGTFDTVPPAGYASTNDKDSAPVEPLRYESGGEVDGIALQEYVSFRLADGSVILAWSSRDRRSETSEASLFDGLTLGGPLPKLPYEITGLEQQDGGRTITYVGRHLMYARHGEDFVEWGLFVPGQEPPSRWKQYYAVQHRINPSARQTMSLLTANVSQPFWIEDARDFDLLVRGAMAELSDEHEVPADMTLERMLQLAREIRGAATP